MSSPFTQYAEFYNLLYSRKDYHSEAAYIKQIINSLTPDTGEKRRLLDLACGTGKHIFELEKLGFVVEGSDISSNMIAVAQNTEDVIGSKAVFYNHSFQESSSIAKKYDIVISMFSAIDYLTSIEDLLLTLGNVYDLLTDDGIFIFDYWNGNAVTRDYSPSRILRESDTTGEILRISETSIDIIKQIATVKFSCMYFVDSIRKYNFTEIHEMRYYYFQEMENILIGAGFEIVYSSPFLRFNSPMDPFEWNISLGLKKKGLSA